MKCFAEHGKGVEWEQEVSLHKVSMKDLRTHIKITVCFSVTDTKITIFTDLQVHRKNAIQGRQIK